MSINGSRIATSHDELGPIYVYQDRNSRVLSFDGHVEQSRMNLEDPVRLMHKYTQAMMAGLIFIPEPESALIMGLGAGSIAKSLLKFFPDIRVNAAEYREEVINTARRFFYLPDDHRLQIENCDAISYMRETEERSDIIFSDLYNAYGMEPRQVQLTYLRNCKRVLTKKGVLVLNLWHQDFNTTEVIEELLDAVFGDETVSIPVEGGNTIVFAFRHRVPPMKRKTLLEFGNMLESKTEIPVSRYAKLIWSQQLHKFSGE